MSGNRLTVATDWMQAQRYAEEIEICRDCEAAAHQDFLDAQAQYSAAEKKLNHARSLYADAKRETVSAQQAFDRVLDEMTKPVGYDEAVTED